ncbi:MAG: GxxExxY protein [Alphaproteobacteria bacterium]|nr:GxxExxY protein [Alphaproteobacteria bacterium]
MELNDITAQVVDASYHIHRNVGPGLLESAYQQILAFELERRGLRVEQQLLVDIVYEGLCISRAFKADMVVEGQVVVELKSTTGTAEAHKMQLLTYLRFMDLRVGLLVNFGAARWTDTVTRVVRGYRG